MEETSDTRKREIAADIRGSGIQSHSDRISLPKNIPEEWEGERSRGKLGK